jgi:predicted RecA/RadA family phage recombinase
MSKLAVDGNVFVYNVPTVGGSDVTMGTAAAVQELANGIFIWNDNYKANQPGAYIYFGAVRLAKETGVAFTKGDQLYWDATNNNLDKTNTNIPAGMAAEDALSGDTTAVVFLNLGSGDS